MLKMLSRFLDDLFLGIGFRGILELIFDHLKFVFFFQFYYPKKFRHYGKNIRWGRDFRRYTIPSSVRISCPEKIYIGDGCQIDEGVYLQCDSSVTNESGITLHEKVRINANTHILAGSEIVIESEVLIAPYCLVTSNNHRSEETISIMNQGMKHSGKILIGTGSWLGQNAKVLGGTLLGSQTVIGANALVLKGEYPPRAKILASVAEIKR